MKDVSVKTPAIELVLNRWPYRLELQPSANGLLLRPRQKARAHWAKSFRQRRPASDDLATTRQLTNAFDAKEWQW
ncbi:MAG TPA: hypothetical protein VNN22_15980 [Verrucomicrobiae bacterium]|nr:hypothetical protein [Verrucomicrobiae bacterium]